VEVPLFLTIQFAVEIGRGSTVDVRDHTVILGDWMMSNPKIIRSNKKDLLLYNLY
jgi:hypothetical protein